MTAYSSIFGSTPDESDRVVDADKEIEGFS
jgi:hypothetical protein